MIYVFDTNSFSELNAYYPDIFKDFWKRFDKMARVGNVISTKEVHTELARSSLSHVVEWAKNNDSIFTILNSNETAFVAQIFSIPHFRQLIDQKAQQRGTPVADPFVIACAYTHLGTVVTQEKNKPNAAKIPNVCAHFKIPCVDLEGFLKAQEWQF